MTDRPTAPPPPPDRIYYGWRLRKNISEVRFILNSKTLSGGMLRLEIAWRKLKAAMKQQFSFIKPILDYLQ